MTRTPSVICFLLKYAVAIVLLGGMISCTRLPSAKLSVLHLHELIARNDKTGVGDLLRQRPDLLEACGAKGIRAMHVAAKESSIEMVTLLLEKGAKIDPVEESFGYTPLHLAINAGNSDIAQSLLSRGASKAAKSTDGREPIHLAAYTGNESLVKALIDMGANPSAKSDNGASALHYAALGNRPNVAKVLVNAGVVIDCVDNRNRTPLDWAIDGDKVEVTEYLVSAGARLDLNAAAALDNVDALSKLLNQPGFRHSDKQRALDTALWYACNAGKSNAASLLAKSGANPNAMTSDGEFILHSSCRLGSPSLLRMLIASGAQINKVDNTGKTALFCAIEFGRADLVRLLLDSGADFNFRTKDGQFALHLAAWKNNLDAARQLISAGCNVDAASLDGTTPLHLAITYGESEKKVWIDLLVKNGADVNAKNRFGQMPIFFATGDAEALASLRRSGAKE